MAKKLIVRCIKLLNIGLSLVYREIDEIFLIIKNKNNVISNLHLKIYKYY
jgi:hypothetical protein